MILLVFLSLLFHEDVSTKKTRNTNRSYGKREARNPKEDRNTHENEQRLLLLS